jgi:17beta-estradiol 17-dehydrogenase / very-long-chain 3-oxoacyl-CoA reductase
MTMELQSLILIAIATSGFISLCNHLAKLLTWVWVMFLRPPKNLKQYGSWALVTGSTDGIGRALASELASKGLGLILVGRDPLKLEATCQQIREENGGNLSVKTIVIDFSKLRGDEIAKKIEEGIEGLDVGILINNAGLAYPYPQFLHEADPEMVESIVGVNIVGTTWVTKAVLPGMLKRKKGAIVNIGAGASGAGVPSFPLVTIYAATKAFTTMLSRSISLEYKQHGIDIQNQVPMLVATKMTYIERSSLFIPSPEMYSKASLRAIGYEQSSMPYWPHSLQTWLLRALPDALVDWCPFWYFSRVKKTDLEKLWKKNKT